MHSSASRSSPVTLICSEGLPSSSGQRPLVSTRRPAPSKAGSKSSSEPQGLRRWASRGGKAVFIAIPYSHVFELSAARKELSSRQAEREASLYTPSSSRMGGETFLAIGYS